MTKKLVLKEKGKIESGIKMQVEEKIKFEGLSSQSPTFGAYLKTTEAIWYWVTIIVGSLTAAFVFLITENDYPWILIRNVLGIFFVFFLPGYTFMEGISTINKRAKTSKGNLEKIELIALSIGMSIALVSIVGLIVYNSPWGLDLPIIVFSLLGFSIVFATVAIIRKYQQKLTLLDNQLKLTEINSL